MATTSEPPTLDGLSVWHASLTRQADELRARILDEQNELAQVEERLMLVTKLIAVETRAQNGEPPAGRKGTATPIVSSTAQRSSTTDLEDAVEQILRAAGSPLHISNIRNSLVSRGVQIPGRGDDANIIVRIGRVQDRFTRTARGTYGLSEWGIPALGSTKRKQRASAR